MDYSIKPMIQWPGGSLTPANKRLKDPFTLTYAQTLRRLDRELRPLGADRVIFQLAVNESDIRMDGRLYASARPAHPGIVVTFQSKHGPLSYYSDTYADWRANLRAITLTLQYLRRVDEHGVNKKGAQYEGYKRLPPAGATNGRKVMSDPEEAAAFISKHFPELGPDQILASSPLFETAYRQAARKLHPQAGPGNEEAWIDLQEAAALLRKHHGLDVRQVSRDEESQ